MIAAPVLDYYGGGAISSFHITACYQTGSIYFEIYRGMLACGFNISWTPVLQH